MYERFGGEVHVTLENPSRRLRMHIVHSPPYPVKCEYSNRIFSILKNDLFIITIKICPLDAYISFEIHFVSCRINDQVFDILAFDDES